ncbi:glycine oxidase ThiO [Brachybacterium sp. AOP25-B2-12]|uniref:glycine oxidase ThiO n=1 Tax=Brachybacterium sp. AOP25-B2-12 TaxID=3457710 RepID=UPI0040343909
MHVVVVGAGIIGLLTALELSERGHRVDVVSTGIAEGATHAAAGMLAPAAEVQVGQGPLWQLMREAAADHRALAARIPALSRVLDHPLSARDAGYREDATLVVGRDHADVAGLRDLAVLQRAAGSEVDELTAREARRLEPALGPGIAGAVRIAADHQVDPRLLAHTVHAVLGARGVGIELRSVEDLDALPGDRIVLAAGLGAPGIAGPHRALDLALRPVRGDVLRLRVPREILAPGEEHLLTGTVRAVVRGRPVYLVPRDGLGLVLGATSREDALAGTSAGGVLQLLQDAAEILPAIRETELVETTTRDRPGTPDDLPLLGPVPGDPRVIVSTGYHRHGILLSAWAARRTADLVDGHPDPLPGAVRPERFTKEDA